MSGSNWIGDQQLVDNPSPIHREIIIDKVSPDLKKLIHDQEAEFDGLREWLIKSERQMMINLRQHESNIIHQANLVKEMFLLSFQKQKEITDNASNAEFRRWKVLLYALILSDIAILINSILLLRHK